MNGTWYVRYFGASAGALMVVGGLLGAISPGYLSLAFAGFFIVIIMVSAALLGLVVLALSLLFNGARQ